MPQASLYSTRRGFHGERPLLWQKCLRIPLLCFFRYLSPASCAGEVAHVAEATSNQRRAQTLVRLPRYMFNEISSAHYLRGYKNVKAVILLDLLPTSQQLLLHFLLSCTVFSFESVFHIVVWKFKCKYFHARCRQIVSVCIVRITYM